MIPSSRCCFDSALSSLFEQCDPPVGRPEVPAAQYMRRDSLYGLKLLCRCFRGAPRSASDMSSIRGINGLSFQGGDPVSCAPSAWRCGLHPGPSGDEQQVYALPQPSFPLRTRPLFGCSRTVPPLTSNPNATSILHIHPELMVGRVQRWPKSEYRNHHVGVQKFRGPSEVKKRGQTLEECLDFRSVIDVYPRNPRPK
jgi:hypothetical protein